MRKYSVSEFFYDISFEDYPLKKHLPLNKKYLRGGSTITYQCSMTIIMNSIYGR